MKKKAKVRKIAGLEFGPKKSKAQRKREALERKAKFETKAALNALVNEFQTTTAQRFAALSDTIEQQLKPIIAAAAEIQIAKAGFDAQLQTFGETLKGRLNLFDELDPVDVEGIFRDEKGPEVTDEEVHGAVEVLGL